MNEGQISDADKLISDYWIYLNNVRGNSIKESTKLHYKETAQTELEFRWDSLYHESFQKFSFDQIGLVKLNKLIISDFNPRGFNGLNSFYDFIQAYIHEDITKKYFMKPKTPLNQILYGPPGTGKTYSTIDVVSEIVSPNNELSRTEKIALFDELVSENRAYFTTFHQSMSYEEFIEGIKPKTVKDQVQYEISDGIFKSICEQCLDEIKEIKNQKITTIDSNLSFREKFNEFVKAIQLGIVNIKTRSGIDVRLSKISVAGNMRLITGDETRDYIISMNRLEKLVSAFPNPSKIVNIHEEIRNVIGGSHSSLYYAALEAFLKFDSELQKTITLEGKELELKEMKLTKDEIYDLPPYFLIIDEINRGNVSAIFGELITLLEEDKRFGKVNQLFIKLPYSKEDFIVPPNLYIIGTMNTADRSVEALDTALRRRFSFVEMLPQPELITTNGKAKEGKIVDIDLVELLKIINNRIEVLVDRDHTIGHSYFMDVSNLDELRLAFKNKVIPLLQEYFYGDYHKIELIIGEDFFSKPEVKNIKFAAKSDVIEREGVVYHLKDIEDKSVINDDYFISMLEKLISGVE